MTDPQLAEAPQQEAPPPRPPVSRREQARRRDLLAVGILTPALLISLLFGLIVFGSVFYPEPIALDTPTPDPNFQPTPTPTVLVQPIDTQKLVAGIVESPTPFEWPDVGDFRANPDPGRPAEQADYVPPISAIEMRRLIQAISVSVIEHSNPEQAQAAAAELVKAYPRRPAKAKVLDLTVDTGYLPDDSAYGLVIVSGRYRIHLEAVAASPPFRPSQRSDVEYQTQHLADHVMRRFQEVTGGVKRTGPEATAVHWRDHIIRALPFGK